MGNGGERYETRGDSRVGGELGISAIWTRKGMVEKRDFAGLELGPPDISIRNVEARTYFVVVLFWGGGVGELGRAGRGGVAGCYASVRHTRPP